MEISPVMRSLALDAVMPAAADGAETLRPEGPTATAPGTPAGHGLQSAALQTFARPHAPVLDPLRATESALGATLQEGRASAVVVEPLVPATVSALQIDAAALWPPMRHGFDAPWPQAPQAAMPESPSQPPGSETEREDGDDDGATAPGDERRDTAAGFDDTDADAAWCETLAGALRDALATSTPAPALLAATGQWRRGRCVVLACPQTPDPSGQAWAFVLWPRAERRLSRPAPAPTILHGLRGLRVDARLAWSDPPRGLQWRHIRVVKEHLPRRGRQLVALEDADGAVLSCEVQLGPLLSRPLRRCEVRVGIDAVRRFWSALGTQWSATVVVCSQPLAGTVLPDTVESTC